jgi:hypothetical protein
MTNDYFLMTYKIVTEKQKQIKSTNHEKNF